MDKFLNQNLLVQLPIYEWERKGIPNDKEILG